MALFPRAPFYALRGAIPAAAPDFYRSLLETTLARPASVLPPGKQLTDLPPQRIVAAVPFTQGTPLTFFQRPFAQYDWPVPRQAFRPPSADVYTNLFLTTATTQRPFSQTNWPLPQSPYRLAPDLYQNLLETALKPPAGAKPFAQYDWPLSQQPQPPGNTLHARAFGPSAAVVQQPPFAQYDWPLPQTPAYPWAVEQHQNYLVYGAFIIGPGQQLTDLPRQPIATGVPDLYQNLLETTLRPALPQGLPPGKQLTDLPPQRIATVAPYTQGAPLTFWQRPFAQYDWPLPRPPQPLISAAPTKWFAPSVTIQQPPFAQYDWPVPRIISGVAPTDPPINLALKSATPPPPPFAQYDWPLLRFPPPAGIITTSFSSPEALLALTVANWTAGNVWWITASGNPGDRAWVSIGLGPNPTYQTRLRSLYLVLSGSSAGSATMVVRDGLTGIGTIIFEADLYTAANGWNFLDYNEIDLRASVGNVLTVEFVTGTPGDVQEINAGGDYVAPGTLYGV
jgi:hypothetical protein